MTEVNENTGTAADGVQSNAATDTNQELISTQIHLDVNDNLFAIADKIFASIGGSGQTPGNLIKGLAWAMEKASAATLAAIPVEAPDSDVHNAQ